MARRCSARATTGVEPSRWGTADDHQAANPEVWSAGINLRFSGATGLWGFSVTYQHGENQDNDGSGDEELDQFLRSIWLECCGHLSAFQIGSFQHDEDDLDVPLSESANEPAAEPTPEP